jgi:hypothetical protein
MKQSIKFSAALSLLFVLCNLITPKLFAQTTSNGIFFQAVARDNFSNPAKDRKIYVQSSIIQSTATGTKVLTEEYQTTTDATGVFSISVGLGTRIGGTASNLTGIDWANGPYFLNLKVAITPVAPITSWNYKNEWIDLGSTPFGVVPYALYAGTANGLDGKLSIKDTTSMLAIYAKVQAVKTLESTVNTKVGATDTAAMLAPYRKMVNEIIASNITSLTADAINAALNSKVNLVDSNKIYVTPSLLAARAFDSTNINNSLALKANTSDVNTSLALKENASNKSTAVDLGGASPSDVLFPTQKAVKDYLAANNAGGGVADGGITTIKIADAAVTDAKINTVSGSKVIGNITGNAATATTAGNITATTNTTLTSLSNLSTVGTITSGVWSGTAVAIEKGGTGATTASAARTNLGLVIGTNVQAPLVAGTDYLAPTGSAASLTNFPTFNQSTTGNAATATSATTATTAGTASTATKLATSRNINGVAFDGSGDITVTADAGTLTGTTLKSTVTGSSLTSVGTLANLTVTNPIAGSITGNAATATTAGNITATTNTTLTSLSNLSTVGTITSGVWSGTAVTVAKGGTGLSAAGTNGQVLTSTNAGTLTWTTPSGGGDVHTIGETYGGGKVFYVYDNGKHGLIAATSDQSTGIRWWGGSNTNTRARADGVGAGLKNTAIIIANQGAVDGSDFAATVCNEYYVTVNGVTYGDWYLPSKYELNLLYLQKSVVGGFANVYYWSSTEYFSNAAWSQYFADGVPGYSSKYLTFYSVRAIRAF